MKLIVIHNQDSKSPPLVYNSAIKTGYFISDVLISMGIDEVIYFYKEMMKGMKLKTKVHFLKSCMEPDGQGITSLTEFERIVKEYNLSKGKSSKVVIAYTKLKKHVEKMFEDFVNGTFDKLGVLGINEMKYLVNEDDFYFYSPDRENFVNPAIKCTTKEDVLQMLLPDQEKGEPALFFMNTESPGDKEMDDIDFLDADDLLADNLGAFYGERSFLFPNLLNLSSTQVRTIKDELKEPTAIFRTKIDEWALLCYNNPNSTKGLQFFRKELKPLLQSMQKTALESPIISSRARVFNNQMETQLVIGEAPIEKIWDIHFTLNNINREEYDHLLKVKAEEHPKYEGRWPVVFYKALHPGLKETEPAQQEEESAETVISVRKTLSLDD